MYISDETITNLSNHNNRELYPNPSNGKFTVQSPISDGNVFVRVYNMLGEIVYSNYGPFNFQLSIFLSHQPSLIVHTAVGEKFVKKAELFRQIKRFVKFQQPGNMFF